MSFKEWVIDIFKDERGNISIKPVIALLGSVFLCVTMLISALTKGNVCPDASLVNAVMIITGIGMGADTIDKFSFKKNDGSLATGQDTTSTATTTTTTSSTTPTSEG